MSTCALSVEASTVQESRRLQTASLLSQVLQDQSACWERGEPVQVEAYLQRHPELACDSERLATLVGHEIHLRRQRAEEPDLGEYRDRFPGLADRLEGTPVPPPPLPRVLAPIIPGYSVLGEIGRGGMGVVYKAWQVGLNRLVALKMVRERYLAAPGDVERFRREAEAVARLQHPHIVQIFEVGEQAGQPYFALEYVAGGSLAQMLAGRPQPALEAATLLETLARAVEHAHQRGIVHRDLKPPNVLLAFNDKAEAPDSEAGASGSPLNFGVPKITDFGLAKRLDQEAGHTESGAILGTPSYMAPEQALGQKTIGPAVDVYALGAILYEVLTGRPPFTGATMYEILGQVLIQEPLPPSRLRPGVPRDLETICLKCLNKEPPRRYPSALALADDLRHFLDGEPIRARPVGVAERCSKWARRRPGLAAIGGAAVLAVVLLLLWHHKDLRDQLAQLRTELEWAHAAEEQARGREHRAALRMEAQQLLQDAQAALERRDWQAAKEQASNALTRLVPEPTLEDLRAQARHLLGKLEVRQTTRDRYEQFGQLQRRALFQGARFTGEDRAVRIGATRAAARQALALFTDPDARTAPLTLGPYLSEAENAEIRTACYELLLLLAEAVAHPLPGERAAEQASQALRFLDRAADLGTTTRAYHMRRARYLAQCGAAAAAEAERARATACRPAGALDHFLLGEELCRRGESAKAVPHFDDALRLQPGHFWAQYFRAVCCLKLRQYARAHVSLTACLVQHPDFPWLYVQRGLACAELGLFEEADADFIQVLQGDPDPAARYGVYVHRGILRIRQDRLPEAEADLRQAIALRPNQCQAYVNLAQAYQRQGRLVDAVATLDQAVRLQPALALLYRARAQVHLQREDLAAALHDLEHLLRLDSSGTLSSQRAEDHVECGRILHRSKKYAEAVAAYDAAVQACPEHAAAHRYRGEALLQLHCDAEAVRAFDRALEPGPALPAVYRARGLALVRLGRTREAIADYTRALAAEPDAATHLQRGRAYLKLEAPARALHDFQEAVRLDSRAGNPSASEGLSLLAEAADGTYEALRQGPPTAELLYQAALVFGQAAGRLDTRLGTPSRRDRDRYHDEALRQLGKALDKLAPGRRAAFWRTHVEQDCALDPVRRSPGYQRLKPAG